MPSINSNITAFFAQNNLRSAETKTSRSIAALSSGNRIIRASDDVSGLAIGTVLRTNVSTLKTALNSANQAQTLLAIADGSLQSIGSLLERQKALAVSANSGTLTDVERGFLNQEFQALKSQIDQTVSGTKFNSVQLIDGSIFDKTDITTNIAAKGTAASGSINFDTDAGGQNVTAGDSVSINGVEIFFTATGGDRTVQIGANLAATINNLLNFVNTSDIQALRVATYSVSGTALTVTAKQTGTVGNAITLAQELTDASTVSAATLLGGVNGDLVAGGTSRGASDVVGDSIISALTATAQVQASGTVTAATIVSGNTVTVNGVLFTYGTTPGTVAIGGSDTVAIQNLAIAINESANPLLDKVVATEAAGVLTLRYTEGGAAGNAITLASSGATVAVSGAVLAGGTGSGIYLDNINNNAGFTGTVSGFTASYISSDRVQADITVGGIKYSAVIADTTPSVSTRVRFFSENNGVEGGGYFDVYLAASQGETVGNQAQADVFAQRLNAAFSTVNLYQDRDVASSSYAAVGSIYTGSTQTGSLSGSSVDFKLGTFTKAQVSDLKVTAPAAGSTVAKLSITLSNGEVFAQDSITGGLIKDASTITLTSTTNPNELIELTFGTIGLTAGDATTNNAVLIENESQATSFQTALSQAFGLGVGGGGIQFQVGIAATETIKVAIENVATTNLYKDATGATQTLDISTASGAISASAILDLAINTLTEVRSNVGALQSRFNFVSATLQSSIQNTDTARGAFLDADIATEATEFATNQVLVQASIAVLAQANQLPQNLLKLIG